VQGLARARGVVWSYRYENQFCDWFQVELSLQQQVRSAGYGKPPECEQRDGIFSF
jgi:TolB-like protein